MPPGKSRLENPCPVRHCHIFLEPFMCIGRGILFDGSARRSSDEPEIELTATTLNRLVRDAGIAAKAGFSIWHVFFCCKQSVLAQLPKLSLGPIASVLPRWSSQATSRCSPVPGNIR